MRRRAMNEPEDELKRLRDYLRANYADEIADARVRGLSESIVDLTIRLLDIYKDPWSGNFKTREGLSLKEMGGATTPPRPDS